MVLGLIQQVDRGKDDTGRNISMIISVQFGL